MNKVLDDLIKLGRDVLLPKFFALPDFISLGPLVRGPQLGFYVFMERDNKDTREAIAKEMRNYSAVSVVYMFRGKLKE